MSRGNQRNQDRERALKEKNARKAGNNLSGIEFQKAKENAADIMRAKQAKANEKKEEKAKKEVEEKKKSKENK